MAQHVKHHGILQKSSAICLLILLMPSIVIGGQLAIIELQHRTANDIIPILLPLLQPDGTISGNGYQLFITAPPENLQRIRTIIAELDRAAKQLAITVVQGEHAIDTLNRLAISGHVSIGDKAAVKFGNPRRQPPDSVDIHAHNRNSTTHDADIQRVLVQDGDAATIYVSLSEPLLLGSPRHRGITIHQVVEYREMLTGVWVTPRLKGDRVTLSIETSREQPVKGHPATVRTQQIQTRVQGQLDQWIEIGAILGTAMQKSSDGWVEGKTEQRIRQSQVFIRVELDP